MASGKRTERDATKIGQIEKLFNVAKRDRCPTTSHGGQHFEGLCWGHRYQPLRWNDCENRYLTREFGDHPSQLNFSY
jgi:hypothetical protein